MFDHGPGDLVVAALEAGQAAAEVAMEAAAEAGEMDGMSANQRLALGLEARVDAIAPWAGQWAKGMALGASPSCVTPVSKALAHTVDELWWRAGDTSTDVSWYTRRALLLGVLVASDLHLVLDASPGKSATKAFIRAQLVNAEMLGGAAGQALTVLGAVGGAIGGGALGMLSTVAPALRSAVIASAPGGTGPALAGGGSILLPALQQLAAMVPPEARSAAMGWLATSAPGILDSLEGIGALSSYQPQETVDNADGNTWVPPPRPESAHGTGDVTTRQDTPVVPASAASQPESPAVSPASPERV